MYRPIFIHLFVLLLILSVSLYACTTNKATLDVQQMEDILYDIHTAEVLTSMEKDTTGKLTLGEHKDSTKLLQLYASIFEHHHTTYEEFYDNYAYYIENKTPDLDTIYKKIQKKIAAQQTLPVNVQDIDGPNSLNNDIITSPVSEKGQLRPENLNQ